MMNNMTSYRTISVSSDPGVTSYRTVPVQYTTTAMNGASYGASYAAVNGGASVGPVGYQLVPVQQQQQQVQLVPVQQQQQQQVHSYMVLSPMNPVQGPAVSPVYLQNQHQYLNYQNYHSLPSLAPLPRVSVGSSLDDADLVYRHHDVSNRKSSSVYSHSSSPIKSPAPSVWEEEVVLEEHRGEQTTEEEEEVVEVEEIEIVSVVKPSVVRCVMERRQQQQEAAIAPPVDKMDTRFFGELLAEVYRKNSDLHTIISEHVTKIRGRKHQLDPGVDFKEEEVEALIPRGASELTKQQIRYLLQTRLTADRSMRLLLSTFSSLREELAHLTGDLKRLESDKESLERDLSFKSDQAVQYDRLLEALRENNRQLQVSLKDSSVSLRSLETELMSCRSNDSGREFKIKELEGTVRTMEKDNDLLRQKLSSASSESSVSLLEKTESLRRQYEEQLSSMKTERHTEVHRLQSQVTRMQLEVRSSSSSSSETSLQLKISELLSMLELRQTTISTQEEEIKRLKLERTDRTTTRTTITQRYRNQYPILGLLGDDYLATSPIRDHKTVVIERNGEIIKQE